MFYRITAKLRALAEGKCLDEDWMDEDNDKKGKGKKVDSKDKTEIDSDDSEANAFGREFILEFLPNAGDILKEND